MASGLPLQRLPAGVSRGLPGTGTAWSPCGPASSFPAGRLIEISGTGAVASTTLAVAAILEAQRQGETTAWIQAAGGPLFPPDLFESGVDLDALVVVLVPPSAGVWGAPKAAELLLRSGAFGWVVVDLSLATSRGDLARQSSITRTPPGSMTWQGRLLGLAREHAARVILLTKSRARDASLSSLVGLRIEPRRVSAGRGSFSIERAVLKDKTGERAVDASILATLSMPRRGPGGLA